MYELSSGYLRDIFGIKEYDFMYQINTLPQSLRDSSSMKMGAEKVKNIL